MGGAALHTDPHSQAAAGDTAVPTLGGELTTLPLGSPCMLAAAWLVLCADCADRPAVLQMGSIALVIPLMMFISYQVRGWHALVRSAASLADTACVHGCMQADFPGMNPANPVHFLNISRRCYRALGSNNLKVSEKDL